MITNVEINNEVTVDGQGEYFNNLTISFDGDRDSVNADMFIYYRPTAGTKLIQNTPSSVDNTINTSWVSNNDYDGWYTFVLLQAEEYSDASGYSVGDLIYRDSSYLKCITEIAAPKSYDAADWEAVDPLDEYINSSFIHKAEYLEVLRSTTYLRDVREDFIFNFSEANPCKSSCGYLTKIQSLMQAASDEFNVFNDFSQAQKYIEFISIQYKLFNS